MPIEEHRGYIELIKDALRCVGGEYFSLVTTYDRVGIVRERVFCYEFYHQMRCLLRDRNDISVNGEVDKRGHRDFRRLHRRNPDFVFHTPGTHENNTLVVEVKGRLGRKYKAGILKDFNTLCTFVHSYQYKVGIFILYNHTIEELCNLLGNSLAELKAHEAANRILVISIQWPQSECAEAVLAAL